MSISLPLGVCLIQNARKNAARPSAYPQYILEILDHAGIPYQLIAPEELADALASIRIVITVGGRPVAQLGPLEPTDEQVTLEDLAARGQVVLARRVDRPAPEFSMPLWAGTRIDQLIREVRGR